MRAGHAFISYARDDARHVDALQQALEVAGIPVWRDTAELWPGEDWRARIRHAISDDALVFIACFSQASVARRRSYQNEELVLAIEQFRQRRPDEPWLIPVRFDECDIPDRDIGGGRTLNSIQWADLFGAAASENTARLVATVYRVLGQSADDEHVASGSPRSASAGASTVGPEREPRPQDGAPGVTISQSGLVRPGPGRTIRPAWRSRRARLAITAGCAVLAAAVAVPLIPTTSKTGARTPPKTPAGAPGPSASRLPEPLSCRRDASGPAVPEEITSFVTSGNWKDFIGVAFGPGCRVFAVGDGGNLQLRDVAATGVIATLPADPGGNLNGPAFSPDGTTIAIPGANGVTTIWKTATGQRIAALNSDPGGGTYSLAFSPDGSELITGGSSGIITVWDTANDTPVTTFTTPTAVGSLALSPNGATLAVAGDDGTDRLWNMRTLRPGAALPGRRGHIWAVAFSPGNQTLATGTLDGYLQWWNTVTSKLIIEKPAGNGQVTSVAFSPSGSILAAGGLGIVQLWNARTYQLIATIQLGGYWAQGMAFSRNGAILAVGHDGGVELWNVAGITPRSE